MDKTATSKLKEHVVTGFARLNGYAIKAQRPTKDMNYFLVTLRASYGPIDPAFEVPFVVERNEVQHMETVLGKLLFAGWDVQVEPHSEGWPTKPYAYTEPQMHFSHPDVVKKLKQVDDTIGV